MFQQVSAVALIVLAVALFAIALGIVRYGRQAVRTARVRVLALLTAVTESGGVARGVVDLTGRLVNPATLTAPLSLRPCLVWEVVLLEENRHGEGPYFQPVWTDGRGGDLLVHYDLRRTNGASAMPVPGQVAIAAERVRVAPTDAEAVHPVLATTTPDHLRNVDLDWLDRVTLPAALAHAVRARPAGFRFAEATLTTGDYVRARQGPIPRPRRLPDPDLDYWLVPTPDAGSTAFATGCLAAMLVVAALASLATAVVFLL
jgi:hypothetical protein